MGSNSVTRLTTAPPGTGKTWARCARFILDEWLMDGMEGIHFSNFPVVFDDTAVIKTDQGEYKAGERIPVDEADENDLEYSLMRGLVSLAGDRGIDEETVRARVKVIPDEEIQQWLVGKAGPWSYFDKLHRQAIEDAFEDERVPHPLDGAHVAIDEAFEFWPAGATKEQVKGVQQLKRWLPTVRHHGCTIEFVCQFSGQLARAINGVMNEEMVLTSWEHRKIPLLGWRVGVVYQAWSRLTRQRYVIHLREDVCLRDGRKLTLAYSKIDIPTF